MTSHRQTTNWREKKKRKKNEKCKRIFKTQNAKDSKCFKCALNVLLKVLCLSQSKLLSFRSFFIISRKSYHFSMRNFDDAKFRWRELSITLVNVASFFNLRTNKIFVTLFSFLDHQIFWFNSYFSQFDLDLLKYLS